MTDAKPEIIIFEDEKRIAQLLVDFLARDGFEVTVFNEGSLAVEVVKNRKPALLILDLMLPGKDGLTICKEVREFSTVPILMLTARVDEIDRLLGLEFGADDYVCKPFSPSEVVARVKAILRRSQQTQLEVDQGEITYLGITLIPDQHRCVAGEVRIELTPIEFRILHALMSQPSRVFARNKLMSIAYTDGRIVSLRTIDTHIKNLRKKLSAAGIDRNLIHSISGVGFQIE